MLSNFNWLQLVSMSPITIVILGCSVVTFGIAIERALYFWKRRGDPSATMGSVKRKICSGDIREAIWECNNSSHPVARVVLKLLESGKRDGDSLEEQMHIALSEQKMLLERNLVVLGTMAVMAPLVGLLGTVWGIMRAFNDMALTGSAAPSIVAAGVAEALITTAAGLCIAVPALMLYNYFAQRMNVTLTVAENQALEVRSALMESQAASTAWPADTGSQQRGVRRPERDSRQEAPEPVAAHREERPEPSWAR